MVLALFRRLFVYDDAMALAVVSMLCFSGLGSLGGSLVAKHWLLPLAAAGFGVLMLGGNRVPLAGVFLAAAPGRLCYWQFLPRAFDRAAANPLAVFALDAIGAGLGAPPGHLSADPLGFRGDFRHGRCPCSVLPPRPTHCSIEDFRPGQQ